jgi:5S rRNA maturation endonuclease (ribonuclease M5)
MNKLLNKKEFANYQSALDLLQTHCAEMLSRKIPEANIQQAFTLQTTLDLIPTTGNLLSAGCWEDTATETLKKVGYNVIDVERAGDWIGVCEGELDTITLSACIGIPCVGVPGANSWKKHYTRLLADFERVFVFADGDQPGKEFAAGLARELPVTIVSMPDGEDVNSIYVKHGADYIRDKIGLNSD